jgi:polysaccharide biosynthesis protein PslG
VRLRFVVLPLLALLAILAPTPALSEARGPAVIGIADQKPAFLTDPGFLKLGIRHARIAVAWDALKSDWQLAELDRWMSAAKAGGVQPLVTFDRSRLAGKGRVLPTPAQFQAQFRAFRLRYPWVRDFSTWNEANFPGQATYARPDLTARYYKALKSACKACHVLGADLLDLPSMTRWVKKFTKVAGQPRYWGLHNYVSANRLSTASTKALLKVTTGEIWLTETGGLVARRNKSLISLPQGKTHAAKVTRFILGDLLRLSSRITHVYLYQWNSSTSADTWDSALVGADEKARPSLAVLQQALAGKKLV